MELTLDRADLVRELGLMDKVVAKKLTIPAIGNVRIDAGGSGAVLSATDLDLALISRCPAKAVAQAGAQLAPARKLFDLARSLAGDTVNIRTDGNGAGIASGGVKARLQSPPVEEFPPIPSPPEKTSAMFPMTSLQRILARVAFATATDDNRFFLDGVQLESDGEVLTAVASDGRRLAWAEIAFKGEPFPATLVSRKAITALMAVMEASDENVADVTYSEEGNHMFFTVGDRLVVTRKVDGKFPAYRRIVPKPQEKQAVLPRPLFGDALSRAVLVRGDDRVVALSLSANELKVVGSSADVGEVTERIEVEYAGPDLTITLNASYVQDFLGACGAGKVSMDCASDASPVVFRPVDGDIRYTYIVMPLRA